jgi:hypothetical protein
MDIGRNIAVSNALEKVQFCLKQLEKGEFVKGLDWDSNVVPRCTLEEIIGALVAAEHEMAGVRQ